MRRRVQKIFRAAKSNIGTFLGTLAGILLFSLFTAALGYYYLVVEHPGVHLDRDNILGAISPESPVYYNDGKEKIGVFFAKDHRNYVPYKEIPEILIDSILSAEDRTFFSHSGINFLGLFRAIVTNILAGRVVQGGSTITMQTAENLFQQEKPANRWLAKVFEYLNTLRLEHHFSKEDILEFYVNQFHVSGNGRGAAIAARYFFSKNLAEIDLVEAAFIAGSLKGPFKYTPFIHKDADKQANAYRLAMSRKNYVVGNLYRFNKVTRPVFEKALAAPIPFNPGEFRFKSNVVLDYVREILERDEFQQMFSENGIENISTSGIKIITSIDRQMEENALYATRKNLSSIAIKLDGLKKLDDLSSKNIVIEDSLDERQFGYGTIGKVEVSPKKMTDSKIHVRFKYADGVIDYAGLKPALSADVQHDDGRWGNPASAKILKKIGSFKKGQPIFVSVRQKRDKVLLLDLENPPTVEGSILVVDKGKIAAMVGGFENRDFNRAIHSSKQVGSIFKPILIYAAFQLGWHPLDKVDNFRKVYTYSNTFYFPKPDHLPQSDEVSLVWLGAKSENLASIELLYRLCDKLNFEEFERILDLIDLAPRKDEDLREYETRIRTEGINIDQEKITSMLFERVLDNAITDLVFSEDSNQIHSLKTMRYGNGFAEYEQTLIADFVRMFEEKNKPEEDRATRERMFREIYDKISLINNNYKRLQKAYQELKARKTFFESVLEKLNGMDESADPTALLSKEENSRLVDYTDFYYHDLSQDRTCYYDEEYLHVVDNQEVPVVSGLDPFHPYRMPPLKNKYTAKELLELYRNPDRVSEIKLNGTIGAAILDELEGSLAKAVDRIPALLRYHPKHLFQSRDFRLLVGLRYLKIMLKRMGVDGPIREVLSFPLGSNAVSILDVAKIYETMAHGKAYLPDGNDIALIETVLDAKDRVIYRNIPYEKQIVIPEYSMMIKSILRQVFEFGTAAGMKDRVILQLPPSRGVSAKIGLPLFGKTGTTNDYTNAVFAGYFPYFVGDETKFQADNLLTVVSYVGYDDNKQMKHKGFKISGSSGGLPQWVDFARMTALDKGYTDNLVGEALDDLEFSDLKEIGFSYELKPVGYFALETIGGLPIDGEPVLSERPKIHAAGRSFIEVLLDGDNPFRGINPFSR